MGSWEKVKRVLTDLNASVETSRSTEAEEEP